VDSADIVRELEELTIKLKALTRIPLRIIAAQPVTAGFRYTEAYPHSGENEPR